MSLEARLEAILRRSAPLMQVLETARTLALPDWMIFSGAVYQRVLNDLTGRDLDYGIKDYDLGYFDASDVSYEAEDVVIRRVAAAFAPPLRELVEVRNQARVHLWFEGKFGESYTPLSSTAEAVERFVSPLFAVGVRLTDERMEVTAPFGLEDLFSLRLRPSPVRPISEFERKVTPLLSRWPDLRIEG